MWASVALVLAVSVWAADAPESAGSAAPAGNDSAQKPQKTEAAVSMVGETTKPGQNRIAVGETFVIRLAGNPTTGYQWVLKSIDRKIAEPTGPLEYKQDEAKPGMVGVGGAYSLTIRGVKPGKTTAVLEYRRSWEKGAPAKTFKAQITVVPKK